MVQVIKKMKSTASHKITAAKDAAANLAFRGRNLLSGNAGEVILTQPSKSCWRLSLAPCSLRGSMPCSGKRCSRP